MAGNTQAATHNNHTTPEVVGDWSDFHVVRIKMLVTRTRTTAVALSASTLWNGPVSPRYISQYERPARYSNEIGKPNMKTSSRIRLEIDDVTRSPND